MAGDVAPRPGQQLSGRPGNPIELDAPQDLVDTSADWERRVRRRSLDHDEQRDLVGQLRLREGEAAGNARELGNLERDLQQQRERQRASAEAEISRLPTYDRYSLTQRRELAQSSAVYEHLVSEFHRTATQHRGPLPGQDQPVRSAPQFEVVRVEEFHNPRSQEGYKMELQDLTGRCQRRVSPLVPVPDAQNVQTVAGRQMNEFMMYHGAASRKIERLFQQGLDPRYSGSNGGKMFGLGTYLATNSSKADIYTEPNAAGERCVLVVRATLGEAYYENYHTPAGVTPEAHRSHIMSRRLPPERADNRGPLSSIVGVTRQNGGAVEHPEFIVFDRRQCLAQYAVWYRHAPGCFCTHCVKHKILIEHPLAGSSFTLPAAYGDRGAFSILGSQGQMMRIQDDIHARTGMRVYMQRLDGGIARGYGVKLRLMVRRRAHGPPQGELRGPRELRAPHHRASGGG